MMMIVTQTDLRHLTLGFASADVLSEPAPKAKGKKGKKQGFSLDDFPEDPEQEAEASLSSQPDEEPGERELIGPDCCKQLGSRAASESKLNGS